MRVYVHVLRYAGWKNSLKGVGYFLGAALLDSSAEWGYEITLGTLIGLILLAYPWTIMGLDKVRYRPVDRSLDTPTSAREDVPCLDHSPSSCGRTTTHTAAYLV